MTTNWKIIFEAEIQWKDDNEINTVLMSSYPTEDTPEDDEVFFNFNCTTPQQLIEELENFDGEDFDIVGWDETYIV